MMFKDYTQIEIPEGKVTKIMLGDTVLWVQPQVGNIPSAYQEVEWIEAASGVGAYLDLGFAFDKACSIEIAVYNFAANTQTFGAAENSGKLRCMMTLPYKLDGDISVATFYGSSGTAAIEKTYGMISGKNEFKFSLKKGNVYVKREDNHSIVTDDRQGEYTMASNLLLLAQNYNGTPRYAGTRRVYYFRYRDKNNDLICDLYPCYRKSDGVIGMYDKARGLFLTNAGTGSFTKGADV